MSDQPNDEAPVDAKPAAEPGAPAEEPRKPDAATVALAALSEAVAGSQKPRPRLKTAKPSEPAAVTPSPALVGAVKPAAAKTAAAGGRRYPLRAAGVALALGFGVAAGAYALSRPSDNDAAGTALRRWTEAAQAGLRQNQEDVTRLSGDVRALKVAVDSMREGLDRSRGDGARNGQLAERLDRTDRATGEIAAKIAKLSEQLDRVERGEKEGVAKVSLLQETKASQMNERFERLERQVSAAANSIAAIQTAPKASAPGASPAASPEPSQTGTVQKADARTAPVEGFVVRDVYDGMALIEGRNNRRLHEVSPGSNLPGVGRIEAIERRGKSWVVLTAKGVIPMEKW